MNEDLSPEQREALEKVSDDVTRANFGLMEAAVAWHTNPYCDPLPPELLTWVQARLEISERYEALEKETPQGNEPPPGGLGPS